MSLDLSLSVILSKQADVQRRIPDGVGHYGNTSSDRTMESIRTQTLACIAELMEAMDESGWKPWATSNHLNVPAFKSELIDALRFWMNLAIIAGLGGAEIVELLNASWAKTDKRIVNGYDGVTTKCPKCKRALDDRSTHCTAPYRDMPAWCALYQGHYSATGDVMVISPDHGWVMADAA